ncbi:DMT family transporter [Endozoicomonas sp. SCSIO W0465]|uniref:DMT family transporter n=1 Tax=Endozoicomonas sp. SCSIO W0465 TaxID=2918516 RepID=UPI002074B1E3|nr:EamA family transporter [Endozoicomonas sp. SCSIO W0465]USE36191.1 EamA family transporter [Endozoicomonas sp. SCSIO W0465]
MGNQKGMGMIAMAAVAVFWGLSFYSIQAVGTIIGPFTLATARFCIAAVAFLIIMLLTKQDTKIERSDIKKVVINALIGIAIYFPLSMYAINLIPAAASSVLSAIQPIIMIILEAVILGVAITRKNSLAVALSVIGALLTVGVIEGEGSGYFGYVLMFLCTCMWCGYTVLQRPLNEKYSPITLNVYQFIIGTVIMSPSFFIENNDWAAMTSVQWFNLVYLGSICSGLCFVLYNFAIPRVGATTSSLFLNAGPIITAALGVFIYGKYPTMLTGVGIVLTVIGVTLATVDFKKTEVLEAQPAA